MTETKTCPRCGTAIRADEGPGGLCAACLMKMGFDSRTGTASVVFTEGAKVDRPPAPSIADLTAHFPELEIRELVAQGGMGCVYRARQKSLERDVALKILTVGTDDPSFAGRFEREARTLAGLSHPNIVSIIEFGQRGPWTFLTMEFVEGASLRQMMRAHTVGSRESLSIVTQMCDALQYAHDQGVVHRDIKPENVLVARDGRVKVLDFGLAKLVRGPQMTNLTQTRQVMGTPHYMAPEQWEKPATVDHRADIYALGVVFYELLTGELPLGRFQPPSHRVSVDVRLDDVVLKSLEKEPDRRYQHASEVKDKVDDIAANPGKPATKIRADRWHRQVARERWNGQWRGWRQSGPAILMVLGAILLVFVLPEAAVLLLGTSASKNGAAGSRQHAEADSPTARIESGMHDLHLDQELTDAMGLDADKARTLNDALHLVWGRYLQLEERSVTSSWQSGGWLWVNVNSNSTVNPRKGLIGNASEAISIALATSSDFARWQIALQEKVERSLRFGGRPEAFALLVDDVSSRTRSGDTSEVSYASPPDVAYLRLWNRMLPSRPQPK